MSRHASGQFLPKVSDKTILSVFVQHNDPVLSTTEVARSLSIHYTTIYGRLERLADNGKLKHKRIGADERAAAWWLPLSYPNREREEGTLATLKREYVHERISETEFEQRIERLLERRFQTESPQMSPH